MKKFHEISWLHQVFIVDNFKIPEKLPEKINKNAEIAKYLYPNAKYKMWGGEELRNFIGEKLGDDVLNAFDTLAPYSYKCDLARYCLMYVYGGIYFDLAIKLLNPWNIPLQYGVAAFMENYDGMECWVCTQTSLLWSLPGRLEWKIAIDNIVSNTRNRFYGPHDHYPTAGALLGRSFSAAMALKGQGYDADDQYLGEVRYITPERQPQNVVYVSPDKILVGQRDKLKAGDVTELGMSGTNNYCDMWKAKQVYGEKDHTWLPSDANIVIDEVGILTSSGVVIKHGQKGRVMYGPFVSLNSGYYKLIFTFCNNTHFKKLLIDISSGYGSECVAYYEIQKEEKANTNKCIVFFKLEESVRDVEFRVSVFGDFEGTIKHIRLINMKTLTIPYTDTRIKLINVSRTHKGIIINKKNSGRVLYGPYLTLQPGYYEIDAVFSDDSNCQGMTLEICRNGGTDIISSKTVSKKSNQIKFSFFLNDITYDVEFRLENNGKSSSKFESFIIREQGDMSTDISDTTLSRLNLPIKIKDKYFKKIKNLLLKSRFFNSIN
ncbi:glycosyltransferase family 32 protein [Zymomonas mobilis]|uniref:glycosyltransferase family 32 protein n=1 Tax=Zymomonas mobilis TaxID=542 RepID=UPI0039ED4803